MASSSSLLFLLSIPLLISASYPLHYERTSVGASQSPSSATSLLSSILSNLGFQELAMVVPSLSSPSTVLSSPFSSSVTLLSSKLSFSMKLKMISPNRCLTVTSTVVGSVNSGSNSTVKIFVDGVEISRPDLFNDGKIVIHGIQGFIAPLSPFSCLFRPLSR
ncbi:uncharacterized protein A4U43_C03F12600 [Asparagus officinalis]|uniref:FAS1 domain-containing protein n=2 Tax=Asparagus officinalis TaxID=4686 RepID=A0A5P1FEP6_ASPOF|nr:uncharacterized protein A4U43_C03F12600 [Asparagus officinalis]